MPLEPIGKYNKFPEGFKMPEIPDEPTTVIYQVSDNLRFQEPVTKKQRWRSSMNIRPFSRLTINKKQVQVGLVSAVDANGNPEPHSVRHINFNPDETKGLIFLVVGAGVPQNDDLYQYMELCDENGSNPYRDQSVPVLFTKKDEVAEAEAKIEKRELKRKASDLARSLKGNALKEMALLTAIDPNRDQRLVLNDVEDYAEANPEAFIALAEDPEKDAKAVVAAGLANGAFLIDDTAKALTYENGGVIMPITGEATRKGVMTEFPAWIKGLDNGSKMLSGLKTQVATKEKASKG